VTKSAFATEFPTGKRTGQRSCCIAELRDQCYDAAKEVPMIAMSEELQRELAKADPPKLRDPRTNQTYILVRADVYERMRAVVDGVTNRAGWDDPALDAYEQYRKTS
jgi:hypothetical protein